MKNFLLFVVLLITTGLTIVTNYFNYHTSLSLPHDLNKSYSTFKSSAIISKNYRNGGHGNQSDTPESNLWINCTPLVSFESESWIKVKRKFLTVLLNFVSASNNVSCDSSFITLTTHADFRYLDNLVPLVERWQSPISIALYIPHEDINPTLHRIFYLRTCTTPLFKAWISFHLYSEKKYLQYREDQIKKLWDTLESGGDRTNPCHRPPRYGNYISSSRKYQKIKYPINIGRNIAREGAMTKYILASDIELYPSLEFVPEFFRMLHSKKNYFDTNSSPYVFVLPIFEIQTGVVLPNTKTELVRLIQTNTSIPFHQKVCPQCHTIPNYQEWLTAKSDGQKLDVMHVAKRQVPYDTWEPIYVSTNDVPFYDERLTWEGLRDKMPQSYKMCILDYDFMILNNAFLVHNPGIKTKKHENPDTNAVLRRNNIIIDSIITKVAEKYGYRTGCLK